MAERRELVVEVVVLRMDVRRRLRCGVVVVVVVVKRWVARGGGSG
jgi:hypothetical protein